MNIFFDTTVLVAASAQSHPHYAQARPALLRVAAGEDKGFMGLHSIAELYATLTRLPVQPRIHPVEAARIVTDNILPHFKVVPLIKEDYLSALNTMAGGGWSGGKSTTPCCCAARQDARSNASTPSISGTSNNWRQPVSKRKYARLEIADYKCLTFTGNGLGVTFQDL